MRNLLLDEGDLLTVESCSLSVATYSKFQPQSVDFLDISNPKAVYPYHKWIFFKSHKKIKLIVVLSSLFTSVDPGSNPTQTWADMNICHGFASHI